MTSQTVLADFLAGMTFEAGFLFDGLEIAEIGLIFIAVLSAWWPAYRAAQLNVVDALR